MKSEGKYLVPYKGKPKGPLSSVGKEFSGLEALFSREASLEKLQTAVHM